MGHEVEKIAKGKGINVVSIIDLIGSGANFKVINKESLQNVDVCIDFTEPDAVVGNIRQIAKFKKNIVVGTTGWYDNIEEVKNIVKKSDIGFIYSSNFSIGVNIFLKIVDNAAKIINKIEDYDIYGYELHHNKKIDSPSGTAKKIGEILVKNIKRKNKL